MSSIYNDVLYSYQKDAADRISLQRRILLADQPGLGKTLMVLGALERASMYDIGKNILIITPIINAQTAWIDSIERFVQPRHNVKIVDISKGTAKNKASAIQTLTGMCNIVVANHNAIDWVKGKHRVEGLAMHKYDVIVIDESHMVLPISSSKLTQFWHGLSRLKLDDDAMRIAVSGTPDRGKLENRYGTWQFLDPWNTHYNRWDWLARNFHMYEQQVARNRTVKMVGSLRDPDAWAAKDKAMMIRRTKNEVLPQLPPKRYVDIEVDLTSKQLVAYLDMREDNSIEPMVFATRARQLAVCGWDSSWEPIVGSESSKLDWLLEWLESRGYMNNDMSDGGKVVIASQFSKVLHWLKAELTSRGAVCEILDGGTPNAQRQEIQFSFQDLNNPLRIVLLSGQMGVGITLDAADDLIMFDSPYDPDRIEQIEDRVHRASNMHHVTIWNVIAKATIDQAIMAKVTKRYKLTRQMLDGRRGVDFERQILETLTENVSEQV